MEKGNKMLELRARAGIPWVGMGTFGSDKYDAATVAGAVYEAIKCGYRLFDCAAVYGNEKDIGGVFRRAMDEGLVTREDLFVTSKVWNDMHGEGKVRASLEQTLSDLNLAYIDLYFVHWPFPNAHEPGCSEDARSKDARPFFVDEFLAVWRQMEEVKRQGLVKHIALSNMTIAKLKAVLPHFEIPPFAHEMELHPSFQQQELFDYCAENDILAIGYCPLGSPNRPERDKTPSDVVDAQLEEVVAIASERGIHPAEVCLKWAVARGQVPIPFSANPNNIKNNLLFATRDPLTVDEMARLTKADKGCRLVKGHVFLWNGANDWRDLWDENGTLETWKQQEDGTWKK